MPVQNQGQADEMQNRRSSRKRNVPDNGYINSIYPAEKRKKPNAGKGARQATKTPPSARDPTPLQVEDIREGIQSAKKRITEELKPLPEDPNEDVISLPKLGTNRPQVSKKSIEMLKPLSLTSVFQKSLKKQLIDVSKPLVIQERATEQGFLFNSKSHGRNHL